MAWHGVIWPVSSTLERQKKAKRNGEGLAVWQLAQLQAFRFSSHRHHPTPHGSVSGTVYLEWKLVDYLPTRATLASKHWNLGCYLYASMR